MQKIQSVYRGRTGRWYWRVIDTASSRAADLHTDRKGNGVYHDRCSAVMIDSGGRRVVYSIPVIQPGSDNFSLSDCTNTRKASDLIHSWITKNNFRI